MNISRNFLGGKPVFFLFNFSKLLIKGNVRQSLGAKSTLIAYFPVGTYAAKHTLPR